MAGIKFHPEDWGEMMQAVRDWAAANVPNRSTDPSWYVAMGKRVPTAPQPQKPFVFVQVLVPPIQDGQGDSSPELFPGLAVQIENVIDSTTYTILYNSTPATYTAGVNAELQQIVDGLISAVNIIAGATVATQVLDVVHIVGNAEIDVDDDPNLSLKFVKSTEAEATATFQIDAVGRDDPENGSPPGPIYESVAAMSQLRNSLETDEAQEQLRAGGWSIISVEGERKPDLVVGTNWEDRSGFDVRLRCRTRRLIITDFIEDAPIGSSIVGSLSP